MQLQPNDVHDLEHAVRRRLRGQAVELPVIGHGEITVAVGWPPTAPAVACKRIPPLKVKERVEAHGALVQRYERQLLARGVPVTASQLVHVPVTDDGWHGAYLVQELHPREALLVMQLRGQDPADGLPETVRRVLQHVKVVDESLGLDAQLTNWVVRADGDVEMIDTTTPFLRNEQGRDLLDLDIIFAAYPAVLRPALRRWVAPDVLATFHRPRTVLVDLAANLHRERLAHWIPLVLIAAEDVTGEALTRAEVDSYYARDAALWTWLQRLKRSQRWWTQTIRHRPYPTLLANIER